MEAAQCANDALYHVSEHVCMHIRLDPDVSYPIFGYAVHIMYVYDYSDLANSRNIMEINITLSKNENSLYADVTIDEITESFEESIKYDFTFARNLSDYIEKVIVRWIEGQEI